MKFCSFFARSVKRFGFEVQPRVFADLNEIGESLLAGGRIPASLSEQFHCRNLREWLDSGPGGTEVIEQILEEIRNDPEGLEGLYNQNNIRLTAPISRPGKILAIGLNYRDHAEEQNKPLPKAPLIFAKAPTAVIGTDEPIKIPEISQKVDPEAELCIVILERCKKISREKARSVAAYTIGNDVSARDLQYSDKQWVRGKSCDSFAPLGPFIFTLDEIGDPHNLNIELKRNDEVQQSSNTGQLIFDCFDLIEYISQAITLEPGDVIFTGTPSGVGVFRDPPVFLEPGDYVEVSIEKLGVLRNPVVAA